MSAISMTPETVDAVNELLDASNVNSIIMKLDDAERALQKTGYDDETWEKNYMFRYAYELKLIREQFENIEKILGYEPDRELPQ